MNKDKNQEQALANIIIQDLNLQLANVSYVT